LSGEGGLRGRSFKEMAEEALVIFIAFAYY